MTTTATATQKPVTLSHDGTLYIIPCGEGFTCLGFDHCESQMAKVAAWVGLTIPEGVKGSLERYAQYAHMMAMGAAYAKATGKRCDADLTPALIGLEGRRVEVTLPDGEKTRFWVGKSTGWMPIHLAIKTRASSGGDSVYFPAGSKLAIVSNERR